MDRWLEFAPGPMARGAKIGPCFVFAVFEMFTAKTGFVFIITKLDERNGRVLTHWLVGWMDGRMVAWLKGSIGQTRKAMYNIERES